MDAKKGKHNEHSREVSKLIPLDKDRIRFAALGEIWITNRLLCQLSYLGILVDNVLPRISCIPLVTTPRI